ncbi:hypothetical protein RMATCC62417_15580 [Rhizopus microsporus]|nr:hypothetical protein RMATCC62417_15580 [Rhizopus microsporus]
MYKKKKYFYSSHMHRCKSKRKDVYSLTEYRQLLSNTLEDVMKVFNDPAWPVAELIIKVFSRILIALLEGDHSDQYLKTLAVEWLGIIACKIRTSQDLLSGDNTKVYRPDWIFDLNDKLPTQISKDTSVESIELLNQCRKKLLDSVMEEHAGSSVVQFYLVNWGFTESVLWAKANKGWKVDKKSMLESISTTEDKKTDMVQEVDDQDVTMDQEEKWPLAAVHILQDTCKYYWLSSLGLDCSFPQPSKPYCFPEMSRSDVASIVELLASRQTLYTSYNFILSELFTCLDKDAVYLRVKSLKAIGRISMQVPEIFEESRVYTSVVQRVHDNSPSVRDAAIEIVARYLSQQHDIPLKLYELVSGRIMDTATNVRKRLVKLLRELYFKFTDEEVRVDIASKLIMRIADNEVSISDLALKATQEILFMPFKEVEKDGNDYFGYSYANAPKQRKQRINKLTKVITGAVAKLDPSLNGQNAALSQIVQRTINGVDGKLKEWYEKIFQWIIDSLFDQMVFLDEEDNTTEFISYLATVHSFIKSCPDLLRTTQISMLQPYLTISEIDDWTRAYYVLVIYRDVLPNMKYHERGFIEILERILVQLLTTCPLELTSSAASCLCVIVDRISHRYSILIKILGSCVLKLRQVRDAILQYSVTERTFTGALKMLLLCGLLCQHFEFDKRRQEEPVAMSGLDAVYRGSIGTLVFDLLHFFAGDERMNELGEQGMTIRLTALQALGYFYCSYPTFIISNTSTELMDKIFYQGTNAMKTQLMRVFQEFLSAEDKRIEKRQHEEEEKEEIINLDILLGNTEEYAELGVNGSLMQRYLPKILECTLNKTSGLLYAAFEVVSSVIHRGLAHPVLCMPVVIAAETSPDALLRTKAYYTHKYAHDKYGVLLYMQTSEYISTSFQYQKLLFGSNVKGYGKRGGDSRTEAVLALTYTVLKDKTKAKFDFIYALIRPFIFDLKTTAPEEIELDYLKYLAENLMVFDFCTTDELLFVVYHIDRLIMTLGTDLLSFVQFLRKQGKLGEEDEMDHDLLMASKLSLVLCMLMLLKKLLIELYDIPDEQICKYNPNNKHRSRDITKDLEMPQFIDWEEELLYFKHCTLDRRTGIDACSKFEYLIMNDTTALVMTDES